LRHLVAVAALRRLDLANTVVSDAGMAELRTLLPNCNIRK
jgi:hypothetical protein